MARNGDGPTVTTLYQPVVEWRKRLYSFIQNEGIMRCRYWYNVKPEAKLSPNSTWVVTSRHDTTLSTCRACRDERVEPCCSISSTQPKYKGSTRRACPVVSRRDATSRVIGKCAARQVP